MARPAFRPKQSLGQNFLTDPNTVHKIAGVLQAPAEAPVVEIGAGTGALTEVLLEQYPDLIAIEIDERAVRQLCQRFPEADIRHQDVLKVDWPALAREKGGALYVIGNLPYNLTSPILFDLLDARSHVRQAVFTVQKEVAERFVAEPSTKAYGILSVLVQHYTDPELLFDVSRNVFYPRPDVTSAVVRLDFGKERADAIDDDWLRTVVRTAFGKRRKMLRNSLRAWTKDVGRPVPHGWGNRRPETLTPEEFVRLARALREESA